MTAGFEALLSKLGDPHSQIPNADLRELSDLGRADQARFQAVWAQCTPERRRRIVAEIGKLAQNHIELIFEYVNFLALQDPDPQVRHKAIENLWECELPDLARSLIEMLRSDPSPDVRARAAEALGRFVLLGELEKIPASLHAQAEEALFEILAEKESAPGVRLKAIEAIGHSSRAQASGEIGEAYESGDTDLRRAAVVAMGRSFDRRWTEHVQRELSSSDPATRAEAARASGELESHQAVPKLVEMLDDGSEPVRLAAIWSLGQIGGDSAREALSKLDEDQLDLNERKLIDEALDHIGFLDSTPDLSQFDPDFEDE